MSKPVILTAPMLAALRLLTGCLLTFLTVAAQPAAAVDGVLETAKRDLALARTYKVFEIDGITYFFNQQDENGQKIALAPTYDDLIQKYREPVPTDPMTPRRTPRQLFKDAIAGFRQCLRADPTSRKAREGLRDAIAEFLEGQSLIANDAFVNALRARFPRVNPNGDPLELLDPHGLLELAARRFEEALDELEALGELPDLLREGEPPFGLVENGAGELVPSELYRAMLALERKERVRVARTGRLFNESALDARLPGDVAGRRAHATRYAQRTAHEAYLNLAVLGALHRDPASFTRNLGAAGRTHLQDAQRVFRSIRKGENPRGYVKDFIPSKAVVELYADAVNPVIEANRDENDARQAARRYDQSLAELLAEIASQRLEFRKPLERLSGLKVFDNGSIEKVLPDGTRVALPFNINKPEGREGFLAYVRRQIALNIRKLIEDLLAEGRFPPGEADLSSLPEIPRDEDITPIGEIGIQIIEVKDATLGILEQLELVRSYPERIRIEEERVGRIARASFRAAKQIGARQIAMGWANAFSFGFSCSSGPLGGGCGFSVQFSPGSIISGYLQAQITELQTELQVEIENANSEANIKNLLIDQVRAVLGLRRAEARLVQATGILNNMLAEATRLLEDWGRAQEEAAEVYFSYPTYRVERDHAIQRAEDSFNRAVESCYFAARALEHEWAETFSNPVRDPLGGNPVDLGPGYEQFTQTESLFGARDTLELCDFLRALYEWDKKLRDGRRGNPRGNESKCSELISVREQFLGLDDDLRADDQTPEEIRAINDQLFRQWLTRQLVPNSLFPGTLDLLFTFATNLESARFFSTREWNQKLVGIAVSIHGTELGERRPTIEITQGGTSCIRAYPPRDQIIFCKSLQALGPASLKEAQQNPAEQRTFDSVRAYFNASQQDFTLPSGDPNLNTLSPGLVDLSVAVDQWSFLLNRAEYPENDGFPVERITDIRMIFCYTFNTPAETLASALQSYQQLLASCDRLNP
ncbi:MAG: hypothetical protein HY721_29100 [Planctomycetes bacterium]|nr:hypothetical protein [Planctomycetota bacterium]